jgi:hypothetical protein
MLPGVDLATGVGSSDGLTSMRPLLLPLVAALVYVIAALYSARAIAYHGMAWLSTA